MSSLSNPVPVIMYHTVGHPNSKWIWNHLTIPVETFESQLKYLKLFKYNTITLHDLYGYIYDSQPIPKKSIVLTFDDGYLDNWTYAFPLLKKYNMKGTIFVNPEFVDPRSIVRQTSESNSRIEDSGFLSWDEMREMEKSGLIDIQSHALTHTWYPISDEVIDFRHPFDPYIWLTWNNNPLEKPFLHIDDKLLVNLGEPVYSHDKSLGCRRFFPDFNISEKLKNFVVENGNLEFFDKENWKEVLYNLFLELKIEHNSGRYEDDEEYRIRIENELGVSKKIIEQNLAKEINFLCWPGGGANDFSVKISNKYYKMSTAARDLGLLRKKIVNSPDFKIDRINRIPADIYWNSKVGSGAKIVYANGLEFMLLVARFRSIKIKKVYSLVIRLIQFYYSIHLKLTK